MKKSGTNIKENRLGTTINKVYKKGKKTILLRIYHAKMRAFIKQYSEKATRIDEYSIEDLIETFRPVADWMTRHSDNIPLQDPLAIKVREVLSSVEKKKGCKAYLRATYIKEYVPAEYMNRMDKPVEDKVIFLESGTSPSPSGYLLGKTLEKQGKYKVLYMGLGVRRVSSLEYYENALRFIEEAATAKVIFLSTANDVLSHFDIRPETKVIQLWHGVGMFKKCGWSTVDNAFFGRSVNKRNEYDQYRNYYAVTTAAEEQAWTFQDAMHLPKEKIRAIGIARTDVFYDEEYSKKGIEKLHKKYPITKGKKLILYAPTFRGDKKNTVAPDQLDIRKMAEALGDEYVLLIKHHGLAKKIPEIPEDLKEAFAIEMGAERVLGIEKLLAIADICITDYSSIGFEYAIMERPLIFFAYDLDDYLDKRGMYYDYRDITPGPICKTTDEIVDYIVNIDERYNPEEVRAFKEKYVKMCDGHAIERTIALMEE